LETLLAVPKGAGAYSYKPRYGQSLLSYRPLIAAYEGLERLGYINVDTPGHWDKKQKRGKVTRIDAKRKLTKRFDELFPDDIVIFTRHPHEEAIQLKDEDKDRIDYQDNEYTQRARHNLELINACLNRHWYDLDLTNEQFETLYAEMVEQHKRKPKKPPVINFAARNLYRVYNNGSKDSSEENFKQGGRFFGGWWESLVSDYRRYITINEKPTVEIDYSELHPHIMYAMEGLQMKGGAYAIEGVTRDHAKTAFQQLINGTGRVRRPDDFDPVAEGMSWKEVLGELRKRHALIAKYFDSGYGIELQNKDSQIIENILLHFSSRNIPCLPIHDSIIVHHDLKDELKGMMLDEYRKALGMDIGLKECDGYKLFIERYQGQGENTASIEDILADEETSQYRRRLRAWYKQHHY